MHNSTISSGHCLEFLFYLEMRTTWPFLDIKKKGKILKLMTLKKNDVSKISS